MRTIKFRAWDKKNKRMSPSFELNDILSRTEEGQGDKMGGYILENDRILLQFTGLLDSKGKEIYESDILKQDIRNEFGSLLKNQIGVMVWHEDGLWAIKYEDESPMNFEGDCPPPEIIGNMYEDEQLLGNKK